ncbi:MAG: PilZ domain-containing protein [Myxococcota bacterium]
MSAAMPQGAERRRHERVDLMAQVRVKRGRIDTLTELVNLSESGALIDWGSLKVPSWVAIGREVEVHIIHPATLSSIELKAKVVRVAQDDTTTRFAVEFEKLDAFLRYALADLLQLAKEETAAVVQ